MLHHASSQLKTGGLLATSGIDIDLSKGNRSRPHSKESYPTNEENFPSRLNAMFRIVPNHQLPEAAQLKTVEQTDRMRGTPEYSSRAKSRFELGIEKERLEATLYDIGERTSQEKHRHLRSFRHGNQVSSIQPLHRKTDKCLWMDTMDPSRFERLHRQSSPPQTPEIGSMNKHRKYLTAKNPRDVSVAPIPRNPEAPFAPLLPKNSVRPTLLGHNDPDINITHMAKRAHDFGDLEISKKARIHERSPSKRVTRLSIPSYSNPSPYPSQPAFFQKPVVGKYIIGGQNVWMGPLELTLELLNSTVTVRTRADNRFVAQAPLNRIDILAPIDAYQCCYRINPGPLFKVKTYAFWRLKFSGDGHEAFHGMIALAKRGQLVL